MAQRHNPTLDGVRGLAILAVLCTHISGLFASSASHAFVLVISSGWSGVDLFFVLSGFLITGILLNTRAAGNRAQSFYMRRVFRIFPLYYLALFVAIAVAALKPNLVSLATLHTWPHRLMFLAYLQNWVLIQNKAYMLNSAVGHFWSLAVEEQFYLIWPWIVWAVSPKTLLRLSAGGVVCAFLLRVFLVAHFGPQFWIHALTVTRGEGLLVGAALATLGALSQRISPKLLIGMAFAGFCLLLFIATQDPENFANTNHAPWIYTIGISAFGLLSGALVGSCAYTIPFLTPLLNLSWLRAFGKYSYGMYIYHVPLLFGVGSVLTRFGLRSPSFGLAGLIAIVEIALTFCVAWVSFTFFENPLLRFKRYFEPVRGGIAQAPQSLPVSMRK